LSTGTEFTKKGFSLVLATGSDPMYSFNKGKTPWSPRGQYAETVKNNIWSFELSLPLVDFFVDPETSSPVWRAEIGAKSGDADLRWGAGLPEAGYLLIRSMKGNPPADVKIDTIFRNAGQAAGGEPLKKETENKDAAPPLIF